MPDAVAVLLTAVTVWKGRVDMACWGLALTEVECAMVASSSEFLCRLLMTQMSAVMRRERESALKCHDWCVVVI